MSYRALTNGDVGVANGMFKEAERIGAVTAYDEFLAWGAQLGIGTALRAFGTTGQRQKEP